jgi:hypothetical protein
LVINCTWCLKFYFRPSLWECTKTKTKHLFGLGFGFGILTAPKGYQTQYQNILHLNFFVSVPNIQGTLGLAW